jgi:hypothetical protein
MKNKIIRNIFFIIFSAIVILVSFIIGNLLGGFVGGALGSLLAVIYIEYRLSKKNISLIRINLNKKDYTLIIVVFLVVTIICSVLYFVSNRDSKKEEEDIYVKSPGKEIKEELDFSVVDVGRFYDGLDGFSISIPSGNISVCVWTYNAGSGVIPNLITTEARTATEKHTISVYGDEGDLKVFCVDDFGDKYIGVFPENN